MADVSIDDFGIKEYHNDKGQLHRDDGPAWIAQTGQYFHYINDKITNYNAPACFYLNGSKAWRKENRYYRDNGPAVDNPNGFKAWYNKGRQWPEL